MPAAERAAGLWLKGAAQQDGGWIFKRVGDGSGTELATLPSLPPPLCSGHPWQHLALCHLRLVADVCLAPGYTAGGLR
eukprot:CAMPEP_0117654848 /NCGR_PEP_ID=MMETSP0804-20121206/3966_1 /TAXON_ID=1074897 /ORGANISM="Tetraselmis astigmatica, Strain CCMP880" /LENGTH=77 /DNA_ID=CAMNT_0005461163 /DNA_START=60 /DNA_END=293 /DNA_ORIENTATION=-